MFSLKRCLVALSILLTTCHGQDLSSIGSATRLSTTVPSTTASSATTQSTTSSSTTIVFPKTTTSSMQSSPSLGQGGTLTVSSSATGYNLVITTVFTQPTDCAVRSQVTQLATATDWFWQNVIDPVPGVLDTSCYPSQFWSSAIATVSLPPFQQLICPQNWTTIQWNSTYGVCCPYAFGVIGLNSSNVQRPAQNALCTSIMWPNVTMQIESYGTTAFLTEIYSNAGTTGAMVLATAFDGTLANVTASATGTSSISASGSSTSSSEASSTTTYAPVSSTTVSNASSSIASIRSIASPSISTSASSIHSTSAPALSSTKSSTTTLKASSTTSKTTTLAAPIKTLTPDNTCGNVANGNNNGYTCDPRISNGGACCSSSGYCGNSGAYCGAGCQPGFGSCKTLTQDNSCGNTGGGNNKGYMCNPSLANGGSCCSSSGWCGDSTSYCGTGCQSAFGTCN